MSKYYKHLNDIGMVVSVGLVGDTETIPTGSISIDESEYNRLDTILNPKEVEEPSGEEIIESSDNLNEGGLL